MRFQVSPKGDAAKAVSPSPAKLVAGVPAAEAVALEAAEGGKREDRYAAARFLQVWGERKINSVSFRRISRSAAPEKIFAFSSPSSRLPRVGVGPIGVLLLHGRIEGWAGGFGAWRGGVQG